MPRPIFNLATILLVLTNLVPLIGVIWWGWDAFLLLMLYWMETAIIAFWAFVRMAASPLSAMGDIRTESGQPITSRLGLLAFFIVHAGIFMTVHFMFLWALFSGGWAARVRGPGDFVREIVLGTGLWLPLVFMFVVRGFSLGYGLMRPALVAWKRGWPLDASEAEPMQTETVASAIVGGLYSRIVVMHMVILFGAWLTLAAGARMAPIILLVVLKTLADVGLFVFWGPKTEPRAVAARGGG
jgi:hypothetical protein